MVHEVATKIIIMVPMCLRLEGTQGFAFCAFSFWCAYNVVPQDSLLLMLVFGLRDWFKKLAGAELNEQASVAKRLHDFMYSLLIILLKWLEKIESDERLEEVKSGECRDYPVIPSQTMS